MVIVTKYGYSGKRRQQTVAGIYKWLVCCVYSAVDRGDLRPFSNSVPKSCRMRYRKFPIFRLNQSLHICLIELHFKRCELDLSHPADDALSSHDRIDG